MIQKKLPKIIRLGGIISSVRLLYDKKNRPWAIINVEGKVGRCELFVFADIYQKYSELIKEDEMIFFLGSVSNRYEGSDVLLLNANKFIPLKNVRKVLSKYVNIHLNKNQNDHQIIDKILKISKKNKGFCKLIFYLDDGETIEKVISRNCQVNSSKKFINSFVKY